MGSGDKVVETFLLGLLGRHHPRIGPLRPKGCPRCPLRRSKQVRQRSLRGSFGLVRSLDPKRLAGHHRPAATTWTGAADVNFVAVAAVGSLMLNGSSRPRAAVNLALLDR